MSLGLNHTNCMIELGEFSYVKQLKYNVKDIMIKKIKWDKIKKHREVIAHTGEMALMRNLI